MSKSKVGNVSYIVLYVCTFCYSLVFWLMAYGIFMIIWKSLIFTKVAKKLSRRLLISFKNTFFIGHDFFFFGSDVGFYGVVEKLHLGMPEINTVIFNGSTLRILIIYYSFINN